MGGIAFVENMGISNLQHGEWESCRDNSPGKVREVVLTQKMPSNKLGMLPPTSKQSISQYLCYPNANNLVFERASITHDIPYGDRFQVEERWEFTALAENKLKVV